LHYRLTDGPAEAPSVPTKVRALDEGPILVRGDLLIRTASGTLKETRAALCGCGKTDIAPFCNGACGINQ
jgi:CDGSH-type Zn-finger protein